jgi:PAS domain S-box-containing protein
MAENIDGVWSDPGALLRSLGQAVIGTDLDGVVRYWNPAAEMLYGWAAREALGRNIAELTVPQIGQDLAAEIMQALRAGGQWSGGFMVQRKDGSRFPALVTDTGVRAADGRLVGVVGVSTDVGHGLRVLLAQSSDAALILDRAGAVYYVSPAAGQLFGWVDRDVLGTPVWNQIHPDDRLVAERYHAGVSRFDAAEGPLECRLRCGDGSWRWVEVVMTNMLDNPAVRGTVCHLRDVTERRQDRDRLAQLAEQLETALTTRVVIEQAKGFLACRYGTDPDTTFEALRRYARNHGHTLDRVARAVLAGDLPGLTQ